MNVDRSTAEVLAKCFACLGDPTRLLILNLLASEGRALRVGEIVDAVDIGQSTVSHHLRLLGEVGFVEFERRGASSLVQINERCLECFPSAADAVMGRVRELAIPAPSMPLFPGRQLPPRQPEEAIDV